jgi:Cu(I)/Ag(I) efflux system membrane fusion protein
MKKTVLNIVLFLFVTGVIMAVAGRNQQGAEKAVPAPRKILYYVDPMHPAYKSDKPGIAPDCGMNLEPVYDDASAGQSGSGMEVPAGVLTVSTEKQQLIGVRVAPVEKKSGTYKLRLSGRVVADETRTYSINAGSEGYIQDVAPVTTGSLVKKDQLLATFCAPNANMTIQTLLLNLGAEERFNKAAASGIPEGQSLPAALSNIMQRNQQLRNLGMSPLQIEEIKRTRQVPESIMILSPVEGFVLARNVSPGLKFERGAEWYRIADLRRVWVVADVFETDAQYVRAGMQAQIHLPGQQKSFASRVSEVLPQFDAATRTLKVRFEVDNPRFILRPDMFVDVELSVQFAPAIMVPVDAVLDSGLVKTVFLQRGEGLFEPRQVETGRHLDDRVEILRGLTPGENIVVAGNFLLSSEAQLKNIAVQYQPKKAQYNANSFTNLANQNPGLVATPSNSVKDPACGMAIDATSAKAAGLTSQSGNATYYFCSESCKRKFDSDSSQYLKNNLAMPSEGHAHQSTHAGHS